jgi:hypothetical protein
MSMEHLLRYSEPTSNRGHGFVKPYERVIGISCSQMVDYVMDYLNGSLPTDERQHFDGHLSYCPECVKFFETYKKTPEVSREALSLEMPEKVRSEVRTFLRQRYNKEG